MKLKTPNSKVIKYNQKYVLVHCYEIAVLDTIAELFDMGYVVKNSIKADGLIKKNRVAITFESMVYKNENK